MKKIKKALLIFLSATAIIIIVVVVGAVIAARFAESGLEYEDNGFINPRSSDEELFNNPCGVLEGSSLIEGAVANAAPAESSAACSYRGITGRQILVGIVGPIEANDVNRPSDCQSLELGEGIDACSLDRPINGEAGEGSAVLVVSGTTSITMDVTGAPLTQAEINDSAQRIADFVS